jgi:hypothetical protein
MDGGRITGWRITGNPKMEFGMQSNTKSKEYIKKLWEANPAFSRKEATAKTGVNPRTIYKWVQAFKGLAPAPRPKWKSQGRGGTLDDFRSQFDDSVVVPSTIDEGVEKHLMKNGEPTYMRDQDFREACEVVPGKWRRYADDYKHLQVKKDGMIFWGHPEIIDSMRKAVNR